VRNLEATLKDTEYLFPTGHVKCIEKKLLSRDKLERMSDAKSPENALKLLSEFGWPEIASPTMSAVEETLSSRRSETFELIREMVRDKRLADIFLIKYDYHNLKTLLKSEATGENTDNLSIDNGMIPYRNLKIMLQEHKYVDMSNNMISSIVDARDVFARTKDPQLLDLILDKAMYADMLEMANSIGLIFLRDYVVLLIDSVNLRAYVRSQRMGRGHEMLRYALIPGGAMPVSRLLNDVTAENLESVYNYSPLASAAQAGAQALRGESGLYAMDLACDNILLRYLKKAKYVAFGAEPVMGYLAAAEAELTSVRTVIAGLIAGLSADKITERLRETYV
jgi:V/A-type H+-transporting ATPase subunit C